MAKGSHSRPEVASNMISGQASPVAHLKDSKNSYELSFHKINVQHYSESVDVSIGLSEQGVLSTYLNRSMSD